MSADDYIHWAEEMLMEDYDSPSLRILAGLDHHNSFWEVESYFMRSIEELNIEEPEAKIAIRAYACKIAQQVINGQYDSSQLAVRDLYQIWKYLDYDSEYVIWFELDDALDSLLSQYFPYSYPSATLENFDVIVKQEAEIFLAKMASYN